MNTTGQIVIICGHYGCGKTNLSINMTLEYARQNSKTYKQKGVQQKIALMDMDIVNPYFRSSEYGTLLSRHNVRLISPVFAGTTLDTPALPPEIYAAFTNTNMRIIIDVGGDDAGITALGSIRDQIRTSGYQMIYVVNKYRVLSQTAQEAAELLSEIETASGLKATAIVNNSNLGVETTLETVTDSIEFANKTAVLCGLPVMYHTIPNFAVKDHASLPRNLKVISRYVLFPWEQESGKEDG